jgi:hypothetical protein
MKSKFIYIFIIAFLIIGVVYFIPKKINKEYSGIMYRLGDGNYEEDIDINVNGYFSRGLFKGDKFEGTITLGEKELQRLDMRFTKDNGGILLHYDKTSGDYYSYGQIFFNNTREKITISVFEQSKQDKAKKNWTSKNGLMISAPANIRVEALEISNELLKEALENKILK